MPVILTAQDEIETWLHGADGASIEIAATFGK
jgi:hypothetical protein